jgi:bacterioferritin
VRGDAQVIEALNDILTAELTAINQYFVHAKMCTNWGYHRIAKKKRDDSIDEMKDADRLIERILFLDGVPNMQRLNPVSVGEDPVEQHKVDLAMEHDAVKRYNRAIALARDRGDNGTRAMLEDLLTGEEESVDWLEAQLHVVGEIGKERYLAEQLGDDTN